MTDKLHLEETNLALQLYVIAWSEHQRAIRAAHQATATMRANEAEAKAALSPDGRSYLVELLGGEKHMVFRDSAGIVVI